jgi:excisionase family DNA binding protein
MKSDKYIKRYVNINEVSEYMSIPVKSLYELASQGRIPSIKLGSRVLFDFQDTSDLFCKEGDCNNL